MAQPLNDYTNTRGNMRDRGEEELGGLWGGGSPMGEMEGQRKGRRHSSGCDRHDGVGMVGLAPKLNNKWQISH